MKVEEYDEKYDIGFVHDGYMFGEESVPLMRDLLEYLKEKNIECPNYVQGLVPIKITVDPGVEVDAIEESLWDNDFAGEDYEMSESGKDFLRKCFEEYNEKYANYGNYCDTVNVEVPERYKYQLEVQE